MKMRAALMTGMAIALALGSLGCGKDAKDKSRVLANVGGNKITEKEFTDLLTAATGDAKRAKEFLENSALKAQRANFLADLAQMRAISVLAQQEGLDKDPRIKMEIEKITANAYLQALVGKRSESGEPSEEQLKALYTEIGAKRKGEPMPPFEAVKEQLKQIWPRYLFSKEMEKKVPITYAEDYRPQM